MPEPSEWRKICQKTPASIIVMGGKGDERRRLHPNRDVCKAVRIRNAEHRSAQIIGVSDGTMLHIPVHAGIFAEVSNNETGSVHVAACMKKAWKQFSRRIQKNLLAGMSHGIRLLLVASIFCGCTQTKHLESGQGRILLTKNWKLAITRQVFYTTYWGMRKMSAKY